MLMLTAIAIANIGVYLLGSTAMWKSGRWGWFIYGICVVAVNVYAIFHPHVLISLFMSFKAIESLVGDHEVPEDTTPVVLAFYKVFTFMFMALNFVAAVVIGVH